MIQISLPCFHSSFYNACPRYLKSRRDLLYSSHRAKVLSRLVPPIAINTATTLGPFGGVWWSLLRGRNDRCSLHEGGGKATAVSVSNLPNMWDDASDVAWKHLFYCPRRTVFVGDYEVAVMCSLLSVCRLSSVCLKPSHIFGTRLQNFMKLCWCCL